MLIIIRIGRVIKQRGSNMDDIIKILGFKNVVPDAGFGIVIDLNEFKISFPFWMFSKDGVAGGSATNGSGHGVAG